MNNKKRAAIYVRVSTVEQETDLQEAELREYCGRRGWEVILYRDKGQSGAKQDRPALNSLLSDLRKRKVDVILVWSLDRLARSLKHLLNISEECKSLGVDLVSLRQSIDTTLPAGRLTFKFWERWLNSRESCCGKESRQGWHRRAEREKILADQRFGTSAPLYWIGYGYCGCKV